MSPGPVLRAMRGGLTRRRVQAVVIAVVLLVSTGASVLGLALAVDSNAPFDHAFAAQRGADATATISSSLATPAELAATGRLPQVTAAAGPFPEANVALNLGSPSGCSNPAPGNPCYGAQTLPAGYARQVEAALGQGYVAGVNSNNKGLPLVLGLIGSLALLLAAAAGLGVLAAVMLQTRERAYHMGVFRAVGMTPRQTIAMVVCSVAGTGLVAGVAAIPAGIALLRYLVPIMGADAGTGMPPSYLNVYGGAELAGLALAGVVIAVAGALLPATWAARGATSSVLVLRAE